MLSRSPESSWSSLLGSFQHIGRDDDYLHNPHGKVRIRRDLNCQLWLYEAPSWKGDLVPRRPLQVLPVLNLAEQVLVLRFQISLVELADKSGQFPSGTCKLSYDLSQKFAWLFRSIESRLRNACPQSGKGHLQRTLSALTIMLLRGLVLYQLVMKLV